MDAIADILENLGTSLVLIVIVGMHIAEEALKGFRRFLNLKWFRTENEDCPVSKLKALVIDQVGLFLALALLALVGIKWPFFIYIAVGFITADLIQHSVFSIGRRSLA